MKSGFNRRQWLQTLTGTGLLWLAEPGQRRFCVKPPGDNNGQEVGISTAPIPGLCHFGVAVAKGGAIRLRRLKSARS